MQNIFDFIKAAQHNYETQTLTINDGLEFNQRATLRLVDLYYNSTFESGKLDKQGKEKPFFNIIRNRVHLAVRATDDGGEMKVVPKRGRSDRRLHALLLNARDSEWRDEVEFDAFRRKLRYVRAKYGGVVVKKSKENGTVRPYVCDWANLITDQRDIVNNPIIERHLYNPADLMATDWDNKAEAIQLAKKNFAAQAADPTSVGNDTIGSFIEVYEVSGVLPESVFVEGGDEYKFERYKFIVILDRDKDTQKNIGGLVLYKGKQKENPYDYIPWIEMEGRALGLGVAEMLFEPQVWTNWTKMAERDLLDVARLMLFQTDDTAFQAQNALTDVFSGHVFKLTQGKSLTQVNNTPSSLPSMETFLAAWENLSDKEASSFDAVTGEDVNATDPYKKTKLLNYVAGSEFKYRRKEERDFIRRLYRKWILTDHLSKVNTKTEMEAVCSDDELAFVDGAIMERAKADVILEVESFLKDPNAIVDAQARTQSALDSTKNRKITDIPKGLFTPDVLTDIDVVVGTENDGDAKLALLERYFTAFGPALMNQQAMQNPTVTGLLQQASETAGLSTGVEKQLAASPVAAEPANA